MDGATIPGGRRVARLFLLTALCLAGIYGGGCGYLGYQHFRPREISTYDSMFLDPAAARQVRGWLWTRGRVKGDLDGDRKDEEVVLATIQPGDTAAPAPFTRALLLIRDQDGQGTYRVRLRRNIFERERSLAGVGLPRRLHLELPRVRMRRCRLRIVDPDNSGHGLVFVSLWGAVDGERVCAWHAGYGLRREQDGAVRLRRVFATLAVQSEAGLEFTDLDKDGCDEILVRQSPLPVDDDEHEAGIDPPAWLSVFTRRKGVFRQDNTGFAAAYDDSLLLGWYQHYLLDRQQAVGDGELAVMEYYLGEIHRYRGEIFFARSFLTRALKHAGRVPRLGGLVRDSLRECGKRRNGD